jgi:hypothetical protein
MGKMKIRVAEISYEGRIDEYTVVAETNIQARGLMVKYLGTGEEWKSIRVRDTPERSEGPARVIEKREIAEGNPVADRSAKGGP